MILLQDIIFAHDSGNFNFNLSLSKGEALALIGASGAGKSTLLNLIAGFYKTKAGKIIIEGKDVTNIPPNQRPVTIMFQEHNLFPYLTVEQNIAIGLSSNLKLKKSDKERVEKIILRVGLKGLESRHPAKLSGGQRQRVALARCILREKPVLLLDEPFTALDPSLKSEMLQLLKDLQYENNLTIIMATHSPDDAYRLCNKTAFLFEDTIYKLDYTEMILSSKEDKLIQDYLGQDKIYEKR